MKKALLNATNRRFRAALHEPIKSLYHYNGCGFFDGGCLLLADALVSWSSGELRLGALQRRAFAIGQEGEHWFVTIDIGSRPYVLDANGLMSPCDFIEHWEKRERLGKIDLLENPTHTPGSEIPRDSEFSRLLAAQLKQAVGAYEQWRANLEHKGPEYSPS